MRNRLREGLITSRIDRRAVYDVCLGRHVADTETRLRGGHLDAFQEVGCYLELHDQLQRLALRDLDAGNPKLKKSLSLNDEHD